MSWLLALGLAVVVVAIVGAIVGAFELVFGDDPAITPRKQWQGDDKPYIR